MARKNSSKTATEKAIQASEPRVLSYRNWNGVSYVDAPLTWQPLETARYAHQQTNLPKNYLMVQNNLVTTDTLSIETRMDSHIIGVTLDNFKFTGVCCMFHKWLFCAIRYDDPDSWYERIIFRDTNITGSATWGYLNDNGYTWEDLSTMRWIDVVELQKLNSNDWNTIKLAYSDDVINSDVSTGYDPPHWEIGEIGAYEDNLIVTAFNRRTQKGAVFVAKLNYDEINDTITIQTTNWFTNSLISSIVISNPTVADPVEASDKPVLSVVGMSYGSTASEGTVNPDTGAITDAHAVRIEVCYAYTTRFGSTLPSDVTTIYTEFSPTLWSSARYVKVSRNNDPNVHLGTGITGIDFYARDTENTNLVFVGHIDVDPGENSTSWSYTWLGNMTDIGQWTNSQLSVPVKNDTCGPSARHFAVHDSRLYYWGDPLYPYRLYIGGNPGSELSVARGLGGAWVDIEPGSGYEVKGTAKWKTVSGANIVTIMCGNANTTNVKRFNLVETNITITNEISYKGYMYEEVSNVVGCNSRWGYGVYTDGLYSFSRYGLMLTTMAMEYNSQMKSENISSIIQPVFTDRIGERLKNSRMVCIDDVIYLALSEGGNPGGTVRLDNVIFCYDIDKKSWYTFTHDEKIGYDFGEDPDVIHHIFAVDSDQAIEGLGVITDNYVFLYPTTSEQNAITPYFNVLLETGELMPKEPMQALTYVQQLEFRFDYFISDPNEPPTILVEGTDYYGRSFSIEKQLNCRGGRNNHGKTTEMRNYIEWIRIDKYVESLRIRIKGKARFRLTHFNMKFYMQQDVIGTQYGFDAHDHYLDAHGTEFQIHHYINDYNNLRRALVS